MNKILKSDNGVTIRLVEFMEYAWIEVSWVSYGDPLMESDKLPKAQLQENKQISSELFSLYFKGRETMKEWERQLVLPVIHNYIREIDPLSDEQKAEQLRRVKEIVQKIKARKANNE